MHYERVVELPEKRYLEKATAEEGEMEVRLGLTTMTRRVKWRKLDRGLRSPQLFYTCPRLSGTLSKGAVVETPGNYEFKQTSFMTQIVM